MSSIKLVKCVSCPAKGPRNVSSIPSPRASVWGIPNAHNTYKRNCSSFVLFAATRHTIRPNGLSNCALAKSACNWIPGCNCAPTAGELISTVVEMPFANAIAPKSCCCCPILLSRHPIRIQCCWETPKLHALARVDFLLGATKQTWCFASGE